MEVEERSSESGWGASLVGDVGCDGTWSFRGRSEGHSRDAGAGLGCGGGASTLAPLGPV